jgi:hypothetical protein
MNTPKSSSCTPFFLTFLKKISEETASPWKICNKDKTINHYRTVNTRFNNTCDAANKNSWFTLIHCQARDIQTQFSENKILYFYSKFYSITEQKAASISNLFFVNSKHEVGKRFKTNFVSGKEIIVCRKSKNSLENSNNCL